MKDKKNNDLVNEPKLQDTSTKENNTQEKEKKKHTGLKVTAAVATGLVATGLVASALLPNVIDELEDGIYDLTKLSFDINSNFDPGGESLICYYGIVEVPSNNENIGVEGFK